MTERTRRVLGYTFLATVLGAIVFLATSCAGTAARDDVLMPAVQQAWPGVKEEIDRGISASPATPGEQALATKAEAALDAEIQAGDRTKVELPLWLSIRDFAIIGVSDRLAKKEIGENGQQERLTRLVMFNNSLQLLTSR